MAEYLGGFQKLQTGDFFDPVHGSIWGRIRDLKKAGQPCDLTALVMQMGLTLGGMETPEAQNMSVYLTACVTQTISFGPQNYQDTARLLIKQAAKRSYARKLVKSARRLSQSSLTDTAEQLASEHIQDIQRDQHSGSLVTASQLVREMLDTRFDDVRIDSTGWHRLDRALGGGLAENEYSVFAGRMGGFKTTLATSVSHNLIAGSEPVAHDYYCLEQTAQQIFQKMVARWISEIWFEANGLEDRVNASIFRDINIRRSDWFGQALEAADEWYRRRGLRFLRRPRMDLQDLVSEISSAGLEGHAKGIIVDYVQLIRTPLAEKGQTTAHLDHVHQTLAELATNNPLWIVGLAQLNQTGGVRGGDGAIAAASNVCYLHKIEAPPDDPEEPMQYKLWIEVAKNRHNAQIHVGGPGGVDEDGRRLPEPAYRLDGDCGPCLRELVDPRLQAA